MNLFCSVCGTTKSSIYIGHGDGDYLCSTCDDWRQVSVELERKNRQAVMNSPEWRAAWMNSMAGLTGKPLPAPRRIWT